MRTKEMGDQLISTLRKETWQCDGVNGGNRRRDQGGWGKT